MTKDKDRSRKDGARKAAKPYASPKLIAHGDAASLTRSLRALGWVKGKGVGFSDPR